MESKQVRHGDVLLTRVGDAAEPTAKKLSEKSAIVAEGEVTGHAHRVRGVGLRYTPGEIQTVELPMGGEITHEEHGVIVLDRGIYEVRRQREWVPVLNRTRNVRD